MRKYFIGYVLQAISILYADVYMYLCIISFCLFNKIILFLFMSRWHSTKVSSISCAKFIYPCIPRNKIDENKLINYLFYAQRVHLLLNIPTCMHHIRECTRI